MASRGSANPAPVRERSRSPRSQPLVIKSLGGDVVFKLDEGESGLTVHDCIVAVMQKAFRPDWKYYFVAAEKQLGSALQGIMQSSSRVLPREITVLVQETPVVERITVLRCPDGEENWEEGQEQLEVVEIKSKLSQLRMVCPLAHELYDRLPQFLLDAIVKHQELDAIVPAVQQPSFHADSLLGGLPCKVIWCSDDSLCFVETCNTCGCMQSTLCAHLCGWQLPFGDSDVVQHSYCPAHKEYVEEGSEAAMRCARCEDSTLDFQSPDCRLQSGEVWCPCCSRSHSSNFSVSA